MGKHKIRRSCGVREAKAQFSQLLHEVSTGAEILITDRGRPVGKLVPVSAQDLNLDERLASLVARGVLEPARVRLEGPLPVAIPNLGSIAQRFLQEDRDE